MLEYYITTKEKDSIRFYQGDVRRREEDGHISDMKECEGFYGIHSAYKTLNCLMFPGTENEMERIRENTAKLNPFIIEEAEKSLEVYCDIYRAMCKFALSQSGGESRRLYRTERGASIKELKKGNLVSFTSTSVKAITEDFLLKKHGLAFLEIIMPCTVPHLDLQEVLGEEYLFSQQKEMLLPPFLDIELQKIKLPEGEKKDFEKGYETIGEKYLLWVKEKSHLFQQKNDFDKADGEFLSKKNNKKAAEILDKMNQQKELTDQEIDYYCKWKEGFRCVVLYRFIRIYKEYFGEMRGENVRKDKLFKEVWEILQKTNKKRKEYKKKLIICNWCLAVASIFPVVCLSLSFLNGVETVMKVCAIFFSMVLVFLTRFLKIEAYGTKLMQRSKTYLALCDLYRKMKYNLIWSDESVDAFVHQFRDIMIEDMNMSLQNIQLQIDSGEALFQDEIET